MAWPDDDDDSSRKNPDDEEEGREEDADEDAPVDPSDTSPQVTRQELRAFLSMPATLRRARDIVGQKVKAQDVDDLVSQAVMDALAKPDGKLPRRNSLQPWVDRIVRRRIADRYRKKARRAKYEGAMPEAPVMVDEAGEPVDDPGDAIVDIDPRVEAPHVVTDWRAEGWLLRRWMRERVASDPKDRETWAIMEELADADEEEKLTYKKLAARHGMSEAQLYKRIERLREKYKEPFDKWRNGMFMALLKWGVAAAAALAVVAWVVWKLLHPAAPAPQIQRDPDEFKPAPSASASDTPFEPALPTEPQQPPKPRDKPQR